MKRIAAGLCVLVLCGFECGPNGPFQSLAAIGQTLTFTFDGVDDDETPQCFEVSEEMDMHEYQDMLNRSPPGTTSLDMVGVTMTLQNINPENTASHITGTCLLGLGDSNETADLGSYDFGVQDGLEIHQDFDLKATSAFLTEKIREHGKVVFNMVACIQPGEYAAFETRVKIDANMVMGKH